MPDKKIPSKKQIILIMLIFVIPLMIFLLAYNVYMVRVFNQRLAEAGRMVLDIQQIPLEQQLREIESTMVDIMANDADFQQLIYTQKEEEIFHGQQKVIERFKRALSTSNALAGSYIYDSKSDRIREAYNGSYSFETKGEIKSFLKESISSSESFSGKGWFLKDVNQKYFMIRILKKKDSYVMCVFDLEKHVKAHFNLENTNSVLFCVDKEGQPLTFAPKIAEREIEILQNNTKPYYMTGKDQRYLVVSELMEHADIYLYYAEPYRNFFANTDKMPAFFLAASILVVLLLMYSFHLLETKYLNPLNTMVKTMEIIKLGNIEEKMNSGSSIMEFQQLSDTFNEMMKEIKMLKISTYEYQIQIQQAKLQYLQIQIRPHFFLNCLKNIYSLAQGKKCEQIQETILALSAHLRYVLNDNFTLIPIKTELDSVKNYILLQQATAAYPISCHMDLDQQLSEYGIPPLTILTFVENSVKHANLVNKHLKIQTRISILEGDGESLVNITILDNGLGFSEEKLIELNKNEEFEYRGQHIGILNVKQRCMMIYHKRCNFSFSNITGGGASIQIFIPLEKKEQI